MGSTTTTSRGFVSSPPLMYAPTLSPRDSSHGTRACAPSRSNLDGIEALTFDKQPVSKSRNPSVVNSTDSELLSDLPSDCFTSANLSRSPSLLTSLFITQSRSQASRQTSSATSSELPTPVTPDEYLSATGSVVAGGCKPILRRCTASASTSASEDCGLGPVFRLTSTVGGNAIAPERHLQRKKSCIQFAMAKPTMSGCPRPLSRSPSCSRSGDRIMRSPSPISIWDNIPTPLPVDIEEEDSDDGGYVEDEEGGFTSDEDELGTFAGPSTYAWRRSAPRRGASEDPVASASHIPRGSRSRSLDDETTDDNMSPHPPLRVFSRGRKVSIAANCAERCSRHISPPPPEFGVDVLDDAPPAARSPSAAELCRRRASGATRRPLPDAAAHRLRGWRSDDPARAADAGRPAQATTKPPSILRCGSTAAPHGVATAGSLAPATAPTSPAATPRSSRSPSPKLMRRSSTPANGALFALSVLSDKLPCQEAKPGLERLLARTGE